MLREAEKWSEIRIRDGTDHRQNLVDSSRLYGPNHNTTFQWNQMIAFAIILLADKQINRMDNTTSETSSAEVIMYTNRPITQRWVQTASCRWRRRCRRKRCVRRTTGHDAQWSAAAAADPHQPQPSVVAVVTGVAVVCRIRIPAAEDVQPVIVWIRMLSAPELHDQDAEWLWDTALTLKQSRKVEVRYLVLCFPCFSL